MNFQDTSQFLMMLWSAYPSAPKLSSADMQVMVRTWAVLLARYPFCSVWSAAKEAMVDSPNFVPSAASVLAVLDRRNRREGYYDFWLSLEEQERLLAEMRRWEPELAAALGYSDGDLSASIMGLEQELEERREPALCCDED